MPMAMPQPAIAGYLIHRLQALGARHIFGVPGDDGLGVVCITCCVGGLKVANTTAQAYAERSPVVVISGAPGINARQRNPLLHHKERDFDTRLKVFGQLTVAATVFNIPQTAACGSLPPCYHPRPRPRRQNAKNRPPCPSL